jgi:hypothetical protein
VQHLSQISVKTTNQVPGTRFDALGRQGSVAALKPARQPRGPCQKRENSAPKCVRATNQVPGTKYDM